jgi:cell division septal protein FtsQ
VAASRLSRPGWRILGGVALVVLVAVGVPALATRIDFFRIRAVEVRGARNLRPEEIVRALPIRVGQSLFDDLSPVRAAADSIPGIISIRVGRRPPATIVVTIREAEPIAYVMRQGTLRMVGEEGQVLGFDPTVAAPDLPLVREADSLVTRFLARVRETDAGFFARIVSGWRVGDDIVVTVDRQRYWFRRDAGAEVIRSVMAVEQDLENSGHPWAELDARFADQIVVRSEVG